MQDFRKIKAWEKSHDLTRAVYQASHTFPPEERYGLTSQLRRAAISVPTNIAEGCARQSDREFANFVNIAMGSASETEYLLLPSRDLAYLDIDGHKKLQSAVEEVKRMLAALQRKLRADS